MAVLPPRAVFVTRETDYELLRARHATREQARFYLETRGQTLAELEARHDRFHAVMKSVRNEVPGEWRQTLVRRADLDRFLFAAEDVIIAVGQDGLVANVAKYLNGQPVLGVNPAPDLYDGILVRIRPDALQKAMLAALGGDAAIEYRTMVEGVLDTGEQLLALNELFIGHRSHQSARYRISVDTKSEDHSSSGLIVSTGTGATGWARSIMEATGKHLRLDCQERAIAFFVREPFPSVTTGTSLRAGKLERKTLTVTSQMNDGGIIFADGIEQDFLAFDWGRKISLAPSARILNLVVA